MKKIYILGSLNMDLVVNSPRMPKNGETLTGSSFMMNPGGKGANQAVAISLSGGKAHMIGAVGDPFGQELIQSLEQYHVNTSFVRVSKNTSSGIAVIILTEGDNRIILDPGANECFDSSLVDEALSFAEPGDFLLSQLEIPLTLVSYAFKKAKNIGMVTFLNSAPAKELFEDVLSHTDYFFANQSETLFYTGVFPEGPDTASEAARMLMQKGVQHVLITLGAEGSFFFDAHEHVGIKSYPVDVVDTTGAGDTFIGAFVTRLGEGKPIFEAMDFASAASALCITKRGAQQSIPTEQQTESFRRGELCKRK